MEWTNYSQQQEQQPTHSNWILYKTMYDKNLVLKRQNRIPWFLKPPTNNSTTFYNNQRPSLTKIPEKIQPRNQRKKKTTYGHQNNQKQNMIIH
jgi:hypothetical protein